MPRLTKIYTRTGDDGFTGLGNHRLSKDDLLIDLVGNVDELNSTIGLIFAFHPINNTILAYLDQIQNDLFDLGGELHAPEHVVITAEKVSRLEKMLDEFNNTLPPLEEFILPRGNPASAMAHLARTVCRRVERSIVHLHRQVRLHNLEMLRYLNRLSDVLFVFSRILALDTKEEERLWQHKKIVKTRDKS